MSDPNRAAEKLARQQAKQDRYNAAVAEAAEAGVEFLAFPKIPRLNRDITITEKIDGTNAAIHIAERNVEALAIGSSDVDDLGRVVAQSRTRLLAGGEDNFGFARWVEENAQALREVLGPGVHFGEWWGQGIQRGYKQSRKWFSLFNYTRWSNDPACASLSTIGVQVIPILYHGPWMAVVGSSEPGVDVYPQRREDGAIIPGILRFAPDLVLEQLAKRGSAAAAVGGVVYKADLQSGDKGPEGIVVFHEAGRLMFKATIENDGLSKQQLEQQAAHERFLDDLEAEMKKEDLL